MVLWGYLLLTYGLTETTMLSKTSTQNLIYFLNTTTNTTQVSSINTVETYAYVQDQNDYTRGFGTAGILLGLAFAIIPELSALSGGRISL